MIELKSLDLLTGVLEVSPIEADYEAPGPTVDGAKVEKLAKDLLPSYHKDRTTVLGMDVYKYSKMEPYKQSLVPFLLDGLRLATIRDLVNGCPYVFQTWKADPSADLKKRLVDTGDGCFIIFNNPIEAICFLCLFQARVVLYNSNKALPGIRAFVGEITIRYALTLDSVYRLSFK